MISKCLEHDFYHLSWFQIVFPTSCSHDFHIIPSWFHMVPTALMAMAITGRRDLFSADPKIDLLQAATLATPTGVGNGGTMIVLFMNYIVTIVIWWHIFIHIVIIVTTIVTIVCDDCSYWTIDDLYFLRTFGIPMVRKNLTSPRWDGRALWGPRFVFRRSSLVFLGQQKSRDHPSWISVTHMFAYSLVHLLVILSNSLCHVIVKNIASFLAILNIAGNIEPGCDMIPWSFGHLSGLENPQGFHDEWMIQPWGS